MPNVLRPQALAPALLLAPGLVLAQYPPDTAVRRDSATRLPAVPVTAARLPVAAAAAPHAVTVRGAQELARGGPALALDEALRAIPGVQVDNRYNYALGERISIRAAGARAQFGVRGVRVLVDGIPATLPDGQTALNHVDLQSLGRVEVVRGPVSSLYGNASGGAILLERAAPPAAPLAGRVGLTTGAYGLRRLRGDAGGQTGRVSYALGASRLAYGGYRAHSAAESRYTDAHASWLGARDFVRVTTGGVDYDALNPGSLTDSLLQVDRTQAFRTNVQQHTGERGRQRQAGVLWRHALPRGELELSSWLLGRSLDNPIPARVVVLRRRAHGGRALLRGGDARVRWTLGVESDAQRDDRQNYVNVSGGRGALALDQLERVRSAGGFGQGSVVLGAGTTVLGGLRYDRVRFAAHDRFTGDGTDDSGTRTLAAASPSFGVSSAVGGGVTLYANVGTAFETPTTTELANRPEGAGGFNPELRPQRTVSYEGGARRRLGARGDAGEPMGEIQLAVYRALVRDALIPFEVPSVPGRQFFRNAGRTAASGVEAAASVRPTAAVRVDAAYSFTGARFREYVVAGASYRGKRLPGVARHRAEATVTLRPAGRLWLATDGRYLSRTPADDANAAWSPAYAVADLRIGADDLRLGRARASLFAGVQNLGNARYNASVTINAFGRRYFEPGPGRAVHVGLTVGAGG